ncbi:MAG TPA: hypothetical protein DET40_04130 [Lentisphaeria bacterium]|nr:MAG: hypothetical protein A2X45_00265 [Lentisphaerae bacterium GWF2_50_93]HCE42714.1 hypothetical protein [Lentisphaeria bacterium]
MLFGNVIVLAAGGMLAKTGNFVLYGSIYLALVASLIAARYFDITRCNGYKSDDSGPATMDDFRKYAAITLGAYMFILVAAAAINSQLMQGVLP